MSKWKMVKLSEAFYLQMGKTPSRGNAAYWNTGSHKWVSIADIGSANKYIGETKETISDLAIIESRIKIVPKNTVIMSFKLSIGKTCILSESMYTNEAIMAFIDKGKYELDVNYIYYLFRGRDWSVGSNKAVMGATLNKATISNVEIPIPPIEIQEKIAKTLDNVAELLEMRKQQLAELDNLIKSIFYDMFGDPVSNERGWELKKLPQLAVDERNSIKRGPFGGTLKKEIFVSEGYLVYEQYHALNNDYSFRRYFVDPKTFHKLKEFEVKAGDILISCSGVYLGKLSIVPKESLPGIINQALLKITLNCKEMNQVFFVNVFNNPNFKDKYITSNRGSGIPNLPPMSVIKNIDFITPPIELQNKFAEIVTKIEEQKVLIKKAIDETQYLFDSLMSKYFDE